MIRSISTAASLTVFLSVTFVDATFALSSKPAETTATNNKTLEKKETATDQKHDHAGHNHSGHNHSDEAPAPEVSGTGPVLAKVGDKEIRKSEIEDKIAEIQKNLSKSENKDNPIVKELLDPKNQAQLSDKILESLITKALLDDGVKKIKKTDTFKKTSEAVLEELAQKQFLIQEADKKITDSEIKAQYEAFLKMRQPEDQVYISVIRTSDEAKAKEAFEKVSKGSDFGKIAKEYSVDDRTKNDGGAIPTPIKKSDPAPKELTDAIFNTSVGNVYKEPIKIEAEDGKGSKQVSYLIFKVTKREPVPTPTMDQVKEPLKAAIRESKLPAVLEDLRKKTKVEIFKYDSAATDKPADKK